ncbi:MAG: NAD(P)/FAD-dependent oxidoreductase, partial [Deltaproteobacteria bacterium]|nr:NAD(P)/FAD-dependent oxidoreductase [Deltaproteobacteria bacterium]
MQRKVDVAIVGGGLSGNLLARQLRMHLPELSVALFERDTERSYKVGESTIEIASHYLVHRLGLARYLYEEHLPKNGLRFFFDTQAKNAPLEQMSELGLTHLPPYPSFQLDRRRMEEDLLRMNAADGVDVHQGARVHRLELSTTGVHLFDVTQDAGSQRWQARWVVDTTGRGGMIARLEGLKLSEDQHRVGSSWARFRGVADMDGAEHTEFRARAEHTARFLSTNHFCYRGHWIWFIPLGHGVTSVGLVTQATGWDRSLTCPEGLRARLDEH